MPVLVHQRAPRGRTVGLYSSYSPGWQAFAGALALLLDAQVQDLGVLVPGNA
jgi:hypothetical protein